LNDQHDRRATFRRGRCQIGGKHRAQTIERGICVGGADGILDVQDARVDKIVEPVLVE
jgi:hypothetical protein